VIKRQVYFTGVSEKGLGNALMKFCEAKLTDVEIIELEVEHENTKAIESSLLKKAGLGKTEK
jgi:hypothetical protein